VSVQREIVGFRQDDVGDWVAELGCHHRQHVRHRPPLFPLPWTVTAEGRAGRLGTTLDCPLCDRAELPSDLVVVRTAGPYDESTLPAGLKRDHRVAAGTWAMLRVLDGAARFTMQAENPIDRHLHRGDEQPIPPEVLHAVALTAGTVEVDFLVPPGSATSQFS
jgi:tellurite resistance-related uncharacterized protein